MMPSEDPDDELVLSSSALLALREFLADKAQLSAKFDALKNVANAASAAISMDDFQEDWQLSQFWYDDSTCEMLSAEVLRETSADASIACVSSPSAFLNLQKQPLDNRKVFVMEFDRRFSVFDNFVFYDFNHPLTGLESHLARHNFVIVDPPFLSDECWAKMACTVNAILKPGGKILVCTGVVLTGHIYTMLKCHKTTTHPRHRNGLSNEFRVFANYESKHLIREEEKENEAKHMVKEVEEEEAKHLIREEEDEAEHQIREDEDEAKHPSGELKEAEAKHPSGELEEDEAKHLIREEEDEANHSSGELEENKFQILEM